MKTNCVNSFASKIIAAIVVSISGGIGHAEDEAINHADKSFIQSAYEDGLAEIKMGEMGETKSSKADVKAFAKHMVTDHTKANADLKTLADNKKVEVASTPSLVAQGKAKLDDMKSGNDFDKAFADDMVSDHKSAVESFEKAAKESKDRDVKAFATKTLPTLKHHLSMAEELQRNIGK